ncbi:uncharacterized protein LOC126838055 isoform X2 [Adelges cooleyi]|nr:uncharacterized protein LOC126838055 isoform X2 [Adelges cooleyi]
METEPLIIVQYYYKPSGLHRTNFAKDISIDNKRLLINDLWKIFYGVLKKMDFQKRKTSLKKIHKRNNQPRTLENLPDYKCKTNNTSQENSPNGTKKCYNNTSFLSQHWRVILDIDINILQDSRNKDCPTSNVTTDVRKNNSSEDIFYHSSTSPDYSTNPIQTNSTTISNFNTNPTEIGTTFNYNTNPTKINSSTPRNNLRESRTTLSYYKTFVGIRPTLRYITNPTEIKSTTSSTNLSEMSTIANYCTDPAEINTTFDYNTNHSETNSTIPSTNLGESTTASNDNANFNSSSSTDTNLTTNIGTTNYITSSTSTLITPNEPSLASSKNTTSHPISGTTLTTPKSDVTYKKPTEDWSPNRKVCFGEHLIAILFKSSYTYLHNKTV